MEFWSNISFDFKNCVKHYVFVYLIEPKNCIERYVFLYLIEQVNRLGRTIDFRSKLGQMLVGNTLRSYRSDFRSVK